jgi:hypothetical protein
MLQPTLQDVPSFLQEVTTVRGQIAYASPELRAATKAPLDIASVDDIQLATMELLVPLSELSERNMKVSRGRSDDHTQVPNCKYVSFPRMLCFSSMAV